MKRLLVVVGLLVGLLSPVSAFASPLDSFTNGLGDMINPNGSEAQTVTYEQDFNESYSSPSVSTLSDEASTVDYVNSTLDSFNSVPWTGANYSLLTSVRVFIGAAAGNISGNFRVILIGAAIGIVFLWWGVRKAIRMIMTAFRSGKQTV